MATVLLPMVPANAQEPSFAIQPEVLVSDAVVAGDVEVSRFGTYIALYDATELNSIRMFDADLQPQWRFAMARTWAGSWDAGSVIQFAPDESFLIFPAARNTNDICVCDPVRGEPIEVLTGHEDSVQALSLSPDGEHLVSASYRELFLWRREGDGFALSGRIASFEPYVHSVEFLPGGERFAVSTTVDYRRGVSIYGIGGGELKRLFRYDFEDRNITHDIYQIAVSPDGTWLAAGYADSLLLFALEERGARLEQQIEEIDLGTVTSASFTPDSGTLVTGHHRFLRAWRYEAGEWRVESTARTQQPRSADIEFSADGSRLYLASNAEENALSRYEAVGAGASPLGLLLRSLDNPLSQAQKRALTERLVGEILSDVRKAALAPRDMFETAEEYRTRVDEAGAAILSHLQEAVEEHYGVERRENPAAMYDVVVPLEERGTYDIYRERYDLTALGTHAWAQLDRDTARSLYRGWERARVRATRFERDGRTDYADFRLVHPTSKREYPVVLERNPFTGERMNPARNLVPAVPVGADLLLRDLQFDGIFPALYQRYGAHPFGRVTVENNGTRIINDVELTVSIEGVTEGTRKLSLPSSLAAGQQVPADLTAPVRLEVLSEAEGGTATLEISVSYRTGDERIEGDVSRQIRILNRNAIQWVDDRRVGAFMTVSNPAFLRWSSAILAEQPGQPTAALTRNLLYAMQAFEALRASGLRYVIDPNSAYESLSADARAIDYLRFPLETVAHGAGDCDDLSVLYATLLESVGVDTAFITTPGHIHMAFDTGVEPSKVVTLYATEDDFILHEGRVWMPVETTALVRGFTQAWHLGALQWRRGVAQDAASFFTTEEAWEVYGPVAAPAEAEPELPKREAVQSAVRDQLDLFRARELTPQVEELRRRIAERESSAAINQLGVVFARYGLLDEAASHFERAGAEGYVPALINHANVLTMRGSHELARQYLDRAHSAEPDNPRVLLGLAASFRESGDENRARDAFDAASELSPTMASRYPLFGDPESDSGNRAGVGDSGIVFDWVEERAVPAERR